VNRLVMPLMAALAAVLPAHENHVTMRLEGDFRIIESNGIPDHETGEFPNAHNPNSIQEQQFHFRMPANPGFSGEITQCQFQPWGVAVNGVVFDPGTAEFWNHDRDSGWRYEAIGGKMNLGLDQANAHVQPNGAYHYHGLPKPLLKGKQGMVLLGYAADGFPVYNDVAPKDPKDLKSPLIKLAPGYRLKQGQRPNGPKGAYDGPLRRLGAGPERVARAIEKALGRRRPPSRITITPSAKVSLATRRMLSDRAWDAAMRRQFPQPH